MPRVYHAQVTTGDRVLETSAEPEGPAQGWLPAQVLAARLKQQDLVASFGLYAIRATSLDSVFDQACALAARGLGTAFAKVLEFRPDTQDLLLRNGVGWNDGVVGHVVLGADTASPAGFALRTRLPVVSNHLTREARFRTPAVLAEHGIHRAINVIIEGTDPERQPFGVLEADSSERHSFTVHDVAFMQSLANVLSAAITRHVDQSAQEQLLREKDVLIQEVHHRVKNSLQLVQTMLHLQARGLPDGRGAVPPERGGGPHHVDRGGASPPARGRRGRAGRHARATWPAWSPISATRSGRRTGAGRSGWASTRCCCPRSTPPRSA